jgi:hypothetical protein
MVWAAADVIGDGVTATGWTAAAMLGAVLTWLFTRILPDKDKQITAMIERNDVMERERRADYRESLGVILEHGSAQDRLVLELFREEVGLLRRMVDVKAGDTAAGGGI